MTLTDRISESAVPAGFHRNQSATAALQTSKKVPRKTVTDSRQKYAEIRDSHTSEGSAAPPGFAEPLYRLKKVTPRPRRIANNTAITRSPKVPTSFTLTPQLITADQVVRFLTETAQQKNVFDTEEAAAYLRVSPALLEMLRVEGGGPRYAKLSRLVRYRRESLDQWLIQLERSHTAERLQT